jgi:diguanylate cyclase (GGDEF)-like protein
MTPEDQLMDKHLAAGPLRDMTGLFNELMAALSTLHGLGNLKVGQVEEQELLRQAMADLIQHYGMECCSIYLREEEQLVNVASLDWLSCQEGEQRSADRRLSEVEERLVWRALRSAEVQLSGEDSSSIAIPLRTGTDVHGVLHLSYPEPGYFGEWQKRLLRLFGVFLGQALTASRMLKKLDQEVQARTRHLQDILEESRHLEQHYRKLSLLDELTGLHNRRYFFSESRLALSLACRHQHPITLMVMDLDRFKKVNDTYGHPAGDRVLQSMGRTLQKRLRQTDILARVGGEEFAVTLPETDGDGALELSERLLRAVRDLRWADIDAKLRISMSIGMVTLRPEQFPTNQGETDFSSLFDRLISRADEGTYLAKGAGGDRAIQLSWLDRSTPV